MKTHSRRITHSALCIVHSALCIVFFAFCILHSSFCLAVPASAYVQDGLVACWDGVENAGPGVRVTSPAVWKDVVGGRAFALNNVTVNADRLTFAGATSSYGTLSADDTTATFGRAKDGTLEIVYASSSTANQVLLQSSSASGIAFGSWNKNTLIICNANSKTISFSSGTATNFVSVLYASAKPDSAYVNGAAATMGANNYFGNANTTTVLGKRTANSAAFSGSIYAIRLYSRQLTDAEIAANHAVDEERFLRGNASARRGITFAAYPALQGESNPGYGTHSFEPGATYTFSAPAVWTNGAATAAATCRGFTLALADGRTVTSSALSTNITYSTELDDAVLTWQWEMHKSITVANFDEDLATVYVNGRPIANGEKHFLMPNESTATAELRDFRSDWYFAYAPTSQTDRNLALGYWGGLPAGADATANPVVFAPDADLTITPNIDCKGYVWHAIGTTSISNASYKLAASTFNADKRTLKAGLCDTYYDGSDKVLDFAMRVNVGGTNYTVTALVDAVVNSKGAVELRVAPKLTTLGVVTRNGGALTNVVGVADTAVKDVAQYAFYYAGGLVGAISDYIPRGATTFNAYSYSRNALSNLKLNGPVILPAAVSIAGSAFYNDPYITELLCTSPALTTISGNAFKNNTLLKKVTLASPVLSSVANTAFNVAMTNLTYLSAPPAQTVLDNLVYAVAAADGAHTLRVHVPLCTPGWWELVSEPTAAEVTAGLPEGCYGIFVTATGDRKGWMITLDDVDASLIVTDMSKVGNAGYDIRTGLAEGDTLTLSSEDFSSCELQHFNRATGAWETFETKNASSFTYTHDGRLTRARWKVDGYALNVVSARYGGSFTVSGATPIAGDNVYAAGAVLTVTASGSPEHPTSHFAEWTSGVSGAATKSASITVTMDSDKVLEAAFDPDEWLYDPATGKITDGEWTSSAAVTLDAAAKTVSSGAFTAAHDYTFWLDLSLPVYVASDPEGEYNVTVLTFASNISLVNVRLSPRFASFTKESTFNGTKALARLDGLGASAVTALPASFLGTGTGTLGTPIARATYEANDYLPPALASVGHYFHYCGPYLVGTLRLTRALSISGSANYLGSFADKTAGVTNLNLSCEALSTLPVLFFSGMKLQELTIGSTNLESAVSGSFSGAASTLERMNFLAHAPATAALDNILASYNSRTTTSAKPLLIYCSKRAPGWRALAAEVDRSSDEWLSRPEGTWGIYQTAANKRFYLVQRDSIYDTELQTIIFLR